MKKHLLLLILSSIIIFINCSSIIGPDEETKDYYIHDTLLITLVDNQPVDSQYFNDYDYIAQAYPVHDTIILYDTIYPEIRWDDIVGTTWYINEELNIFQSCESQFTFSYDSIFLLKIYYDNETKQIEEYRYMKGKIYNKRFEVDKYGDICLFYTWKWKHYADPEYLAPVEGYDFVDDWFLWKIDENDDLLIGLGGPQGDCYYWPLNRKIY